MNKIEGLFTCDECGASVAGDSTDKHLKWHETLNNCLAGAAVLIRKLETKIEQLSSPE